MALTGCSDSSVLTKVNHYGGTGDSPWEIRIWSDSSWKSYDWTELMSHKRRRLVDRKPAIGSFGAQLSGGQKTGNESLRAALWHNDWRQRAQASPVCSRSLAIFLKRKKWERPRNLMWALNVKDWSKITQNSTQLASFDFWQVILPQRMLPLIQVPCKGWTMDERK